MKTAFEILALSSISFGGIVYGIIMFHLAHSLAVDGIFKTIKKLRNKL